MIIFDDREYVELLMAGEAPKCIFQNTILRSCAKMISVGEYEFDDVFDALDEYTDFNIDKEILERYIEQRAVNPPIRYHAVDFGYNELRNIYRLPRKSDRKFYLAQLFLFKYFETKRLRISGREFKRIAGIPETRYSLKTIKTGKYITTRREDLYGYDLKNYTTNKPYTYYYLKGGKGQTVFTYKYEGDCFMLPKCEWNSNIAQLWELCEQAREECLP